MSSVSSFPTKADAYAAPGNPVDAIRAEREHNDAAAAAAAARGTPPTTPPIERFGPDSADRTVHDRGGVPSALGRGITIGNTGGSGGGAVQGGGNEDGSEYGSAKWRRMQAENDNVNAEWQMAPPGEGDVAAAVQRKSGTQLAPGQQARDVKFDDFARGLDKKEAEQAEAKEEAEKRGEISE